MNAIKLFSFLSIIWALLISNPVKADTIPKQIHVIKLDTIKSFLSHLSQNNPITIPLEKDIIDEIKRHIRHRVKYYNNRKMRFRYYFAMFEHFLSEANLPTMLKYVPVVESMLKPKAVSRAGATGLWQFMYSTGLKNNLNYNSYVDDRMDPVKSTIAATKYLTKLYGYYNDWALALAAYNAGPGNVRKAIKKSGGKVNFWKIRKYLPKETNNYVPKFIATMYLIEFSKEYGIENLNDKRLYRDITTMPVKEMVDLNSISNFLQIPVDTVKFYNPAFKHDIIPFEKDKENLLTLPKKNIEQLKNSEKDFYIFSKKQFELREGALPDFYTMNSRTTYKVRSGDYLGKIAKKFGVKISDLRKWNNFKSDIIYVNQKIVVYPKKIPVN